MLGEGPLWHPRRQQLFWFDIENHSLLSRQGDTPLLWRFDRAVSAAGWIDETTLLIATETGLITFDLDKGIEAPLCDIEADRAETRSNDGRADPWGGFWVGTMSKVGAPGMGTLYRWYQGHLDVIATDLGTPNALCFDKFRARAYFADTKARVIWFLSLNPKTGWPTGERTRFLDLNETDQSPAFKPDGAVIDQDGCLWNAQWGAARVARYSPEGVFLSAYHLPTGHTSCPAFGGPHYDTLFVTTAQHKLPATPASWHAVAGQVFQLTPGVKGVPEPAVTL